MNQMKSIYTLAFLISYSCFSQTRANYVVKYKAHINQDKIISDIRQSSTIKDWRFMSSHKNHPFSKVITFSAESFNPSSWSDLASIEYIEQLPETHFATDTLPSDPYLPFQWENAFTKAKLAWQVLNTNDTNFLVGIVDSGTDFEHEDLKNFYVNPNEPINGLDDDNNGLVDDYRGWDFGEYNNDPSVTVNSAHGREMTSVVAAQTDNNVGLAAISYNVKYISAKITKDNGQLADPYEGVLYLIDQGVRVINCSWYQTAHTNYGRDVIDYAISKGVLVVAAAGNENENNPVFPAAYPDVLGVGAIDETGNKTAVSNFGDWVDIYAPGKNVYVAYPNNTYFTTGGTSVSSAVASSAACLLRKLFPNETPVQIITRIIRSGNPIENLSISGKYLDLNQASQPSVVNAFTVFPNPSTTGDLYIDLPFATDQSLVQLKIYNILGQRVYTNAFLMQNGEKTVYTQLNLANGHYILSAESENIHKTTKFTLAR